MAMNPMQRRARNAFLIGFLIALIIMAVVVLILLKRIQGVEKDLKSLKDLQTEVYVAADNLKSGDILDFGQDFKKETVQTTVDSDAIISPDDWEFVDSQGNPEDRYAEDENGNLAQIKRDIMLKVDVPKGTIVTKDMVTEVDELTKTSDRIVEYNMLFFGGHRFNHNITTIW